MLVSFLLMSAILLIAFTITVLHLPRPLQRLISWIPAWMQAALIHFAYGGWVGGVTGHVVGGLMAVPWFFVCRYWLQPLIQHRLAEPRKRTVRKAGASRVLPAGELSRAAASV